MPPLMLRVRVEEFVVLYGKVKRGGKLGGEGVCVWTRGFCYLP